MDDPTSVGGDTRVDAVDGVVDETEASTRHRVVHTILESGPQTAADLARRLGFTPTAVRRHLAALVERGVLETRDQRVYGSRSRGRPAKVFVLTDTGRAEFYQAYDQLAIQALEFLAQTAGPQAVTDFAERRVADVRRRFEDVRDSDPDTSPVEALSQALSADGYVATTQPVRSGEQLCQHHCPVAHVAEQFPQLCQVETELFADLLGVHVQRLATIAHGDGVCTTHIPDLDAPHPTSRNHSTQNHSTQNHSTQNHSTQNHSTQNHSTQNHTPTRKKA